MKGFAWPEREHLAHPEHSSSHQLRVTSVDTPRRRPPFQPLLTTDKSTLHLEIERLERENQRLNKRVELMAREQRSFKSLIVRYEDLLLWLSRKYGFDFVPILP